jgi:hypothetical protein
MWLKQESERVRPDMFFAEVEAWRLASHLQLASLGRRAEDQTDPSSSSRLPQAWRQSRTDPVE